MNPTREEAWFALALAKRCGAARGVGGKSPPPRRRRKWRARNRKPEPVSKSPAAVAPKRR
jgi:hypothetical protein